MTFPKEEQVLVGNGEERTPEGRVDAQLVVRELDGGESCAQERQFGAADVGLDRCQRVRDVQVPKGVRVGLRHQPSIRPEAPEQQTDVARLHRPGPLFAGLGNPEPAVDEPAHEARDRLRFLFLELAGIGGVSERNRGQRNALPDGFPSGVEWHVVHLPGESPDSRRLLENRLHDPVHEIADGGNRAEIRGQPDLGGAVREQALLHLEVMGHVGPPEPVNGLLGIPYQAETSRDRNGGPPVPPRRFRRGEQQDDLRLHRVGVLVLVHHDVAKAAPEFLTDLRVVPQQALRPEQQVVEIQHPGLLLGRLVVLDQPSKILAKQRRQVGVACLLECEQAGPKSVAPLAGVREAGRGAAGNSPEP